MKDFRYFITDLKYPLSVFPRLRILRRAEIRVLHTFFHASVRPDHVLACLVYVVRTGWLFPRQGISFLSYF